MNKSELLVTFLSLLSQYSFIIMTVVMLPMADKIFEKGYIHFIQYIEFFHIHSDVPEVWGLGFQDGVSPAFVGIVELHDNIFYFLVVIGILVFWMLGSVIYHFNYNKVKLVLKSLVHGTIIEVLWTMFPALVLIAIAIPSFTLLYILDEVVLPTLTIKASGNQWFWSAPFGLFVRCSKNATIPPISGYKETSLPKNENWRGPEHARKDLYSGSNLTRGRGSI